MITVRRGADRGVTKLGWLTSHHSFSFGQYHDPSHAGFRSLRVINEDFVAPEGGFGTHPHRDMEIISYVLEGVLEHKDTIGNHATIRQGEIQLMSAGSGVQHSEFNPSERDLVHFLQIWIIPEKKGLTPSYQQKFFPDRDRKNQLRLVASEDGREGSLKIHQDVELYLAILEEGKEIQWMARPNRSTWIQATRGELFLGDIQIKAGDGAAVEKEKELLLSAKSDSEFFLFDLRN